MIIAVDFDGTLVDHRYPDIGGEVPRAFQYLREFQDAGASLILWTMRSGTPLDEAVAYCRERGIEFWGVNENPKQHTWTSGPKQYAHLYIDDAAFGCPLKEFYRAGSRPVVDWDIVGPAVLKTLMEEDKP